MSRTLEQRSRWVARTTVVLACYALVGGAISFLGWALDRPRLTDWINDGISIQPNATIAAFLSGVGLLLLIAKRRRLARIVGACVAFVGASALFQILSGVHLEINDLLLFDRTWGSVGVVDPGRMGPPGALSWTLIGSAIVLASTPMGSRARGLAPLLTLFATSIAGLSLVGYLYGASSLYMIPTATVIALQTSTFILAVALGITLSISEHDPMRSLAEDGPAGVLLRRAIPASILLPIAVGYLRTLGANAGWYDQTFGTALRTMCEIALFLLFAAWTAAALRHQSERRTRAEEALRKAVRRKDEFLATLAHELRNPLAPIGHAAQLIAHRGLSEPQAAWARDVIDRQVRVMARLLDDLLDVARISRDKLDLQKQCLDLTTVLESAAEMCQPLVEDLQHQLQIETPSEPVEVEGDPVRLAQVFGNLLNNACKYSKPGGRIRVTIARADGDAVVTVRDTGIGIPSDKLASVFDMFSQLDGSPEHKSGLGIGLHLVQRLVAMHGGSITVSSPGVGLGSEFVVRLPIVEPSSLATRPPDHEPYERAPGRARRVLVIDDNTDAAAALARILQVAGNEAHVAHDGPSGMAAAAAIQPDVVLLDIGLPQLNGYDVCRQIRAAPWGKEIVVIALTGWGQDEDRRRSQAAGFDHHLVKPVEFATLIDLLDRDRPRVTT